MRAERFLPLGMEFPVPGSGSQKSDAPHMKCPNCFFFFDGCILLFLFSFSALSPGRRGGCTNFLYTPALYVGQSSCFDAQQVLPSGFWVGGKEVKQPLQGGAEDATCRKDKVLFSVFS